MRLIWALVVTCLAGVGSAAPETSPRPMPRPEGDASPAMEALLRTALPTLRPLARPAAALAGPVASRVVPAVEVISPIDAVRPTSRPRWAQVSAVAPVSVAPTSDDLAANLPNPEPAVLVMGETVSLRPALRPEGMVQRIMSKRQKEQQALKRGSVCGDLSLQGEVVGTVPGRLRGCGIQSAIKLKAVDGVRLSTLSVMDCPTAKAIKNWINTGARPAIGSYGGGLQRIRVAAHYACRTRNNLPGGKISEHGKGRAIDIAALYTRDGTEISVLKDWGKGREGRMLREMHRAACGPFGTVLGPEADRFHRDHFHFDTARYRSGSYCR
ncbi:extensin family protein [Pseudaestuariivita sp.]|uniref:extensin family protein n=1 Tax=Pseudaestuariivita sp. TaxID=2211669 RepID=UPI00405986CA